MDARKWLKRSICLVMAMAALACIFGQGRALAAYTPPTITTPLATPDYFGFANYANSPLPTGPIAAVTLAAGGSGYSANPTVTIADFNCSGAGCGTGATATATVSGGVITAITLTAPGSGYFAPSVTITDATGKGASASAAIVAPAGTAVGNGIRKFVDNLPGLCGVAGQGQNGLLQCIPLAVPDATNPYPGADFYRIGLSDYTQKMHTDLPATKLRGYVQLNSSNTPVTLAGSAAAHQYLGPLILATKNRPVRIKFVNQLGLNNAGDLFIPVDTTYMGAGKGPDNTSWYTQNRAVLHLHGGATPWISDGTPNQWITPANETNATYKKGDSFRNVPDMIGAGSTQVPDTASDGQATYFWTNDQGGRLMFYHDHSYGLTRLNVYAGSAAGYLLVDPVEEAALAAATVPGTVVTNAGTGAIVSSDLPHLIPLVIQDKTFVPSAAQLSAEDPTWSTSLYSGTGGLWFPHVYTPNQNPTSPAITGGANGFGRWDYGPWFWPPLLSLSAATPNTAVTVPCTSIAFPGLPLACPITPNPSGTPEGFMDTPVVNGTAYPVLNVSPAAYRFRILNAANDRTWNLSLFVADPTITTGAGVGKEVKMVAADGLAYPACTATTTITNPALASGLATAELDAGGNPVNNTGLQANCWPSTWPTDARVGGVPDPTTAGPPMIQIGTEGGLLPAPVVIPATPVNYERNPRSITITNISTHGLLLGPAERADVIVDFTAFAGKTLILYNDSPAPVPAFDARIDYFTGDPDQTAAGGAPTTLPGYGPNTRTVMQIKVAATGAGNTPAFNLTTLKAAFNGNTGVYAVTQNPPIIPQSAYNSAYNTAYTDTYAAIQDTTITFTPVSTPAGQNPVQTFDLRSKAIQELFTLDYGRMNATLGVELPRTNFTIQTTVPLGFIDPPTETLTDGETQIWKLTHNGVDTHFIHFHLFNVQVINRIGWDGSLRPPDENEQGWKETVRMNPLEDIVFAMKPVKPTLPGTVSAGITNSSRLYDVTQATGGTMNFTGIDPLTGNLYNPPVTNQTQNYGWEYVWHCHILGHEENDMMRPIIFQVPISAPPAPVWSSGVAPAPAPVATAAQNVTLNWTAPVTTQDNGLVGYLIQRSTAGAGGPFTTIATVYNTSSISYADTTVSSATPYWYKVIAFNNVGGVGAGQAASTVQSITSATFVAPTVTLTSPTNGAAFNGNAPATITLTATATPNGTGVTISKVEFYNGTALLATVLTAPYTFSWTGVPAGSYSLTAKAYDSQGATTVSTAATVTVTVSTLASMLTPANTSTLTSTNQTFTWTNVGATNYQIWAGSTIGGFDYGSPGLLSSATTSYTFTGLPGNGSNVYIRLWTLFGTTWVFNDYAYKASGPATMITPANASVLTGTSQTFTWSNVGATNYQIWAGSTLGGFDYGSPGLLSSATTTATITGLPANGSTVYIRLWSLIGSTWSFNDYTYTGTSAAAMLTPANASVLTGTSQTFTWSNAGAANYQIWAGSTLGGFDYGSPGMLSSATTTATITGLPANGSTVYIRLWSLFGSTWSSRDYTYTATSAAAMLTPANNAILSGATQVFTWSNVGATNYQIWAGSTLGGFNYGSPGMLSSTTTSATFTTLPANGSTVYVRVWSLFGSTWSFRDYTVTSIP